MKKTGLFAGAALLSCASAALTQPCFEWQKITAPDAEAGDQFGVSVAMEGDTLVIGAWKENASRGSDDQRRMKPTGSTPSVFLFHE